MNYTRPDQQPLAHAPSDGALGFSQRRCPTCGTRLTVVQEPIPLPAFDPAASALLDHVLNVEGSVQALKGAVEELAFARHSPQVLPLVKET